MHHTTRHIMLNTTQLCRFEIRVAPLVSLGASPSGERRYVPLLEGIVTGEWLHGRILSGGVDWQTLRPDGVLEIDAQYVIEAHDGALIEVRSTGLRHGSVEVMAQLARGESVAAAHYYFRTQLRFSTVAPQWQRLNTLLAAGVGAREAASVVMDVHEIL
jgi:Protein of unknown function (DUF3237)